MKTLLTEHKVQFYTHPVKGPKPHMVVISRLSDTFDVKEVEDHINGLDMSVTVIGVTKMGGNRWLIKLSNDSDLVKFHEIKYMLHCRIQFERFKKSGPTQCYRCQRHGHVASNCNMTSRCGKCLKVHASAECNIPKKSENIEPISVTNSVTGAVTVQIGYTVSCVNWNIESHTADSRDCPKKLGL